MRCMIWSRNLTRIKQKFKDCDLNLILEDGTLVGLQCSLQYSPKFGLSLNATDADPAFALGALEVKKKQILDRLDKEGLFEPNKALAVAALPLHIGLVTSAASAAYNDFVKTLTLSGFGFKIHLADAAVQGERTQASVLKALATLERLNLDLVVIIRGGGSKTDLFFLDNEAIARKIAALPCPVWTGIGHEIDTSVLDYVANRAFKTPTAVAEELVCRFKEMAAHLDDAQNRFRTTWAYRLQSERLYLNDANEGIRQGTRKLLDNNAAALGSKANQLSSKVASRLSGEKSRLAVSKRILTTAPLTLLQQSERFSRQWAQRIRRSSQRLVQERLSDLHGLGLRFRQERFLRQLAQAATAVQDRKIQIMHAFEQRTRAYEREQANYKKRFQLFNVLKRINTEQNTLNAKLSTVKAHDPHKNLKRGFALVYDQAGLLIKSVRNINAGQSIQTTLYDGNLISKVERVGKGE
jgi:exodeoxyribonuclease VII large subunit